MDDPLFVSPQSTWEGEAKAQRDRIAYLEAQLEEMAGALKRLDYWFDIDDDAFLAMTPDVRADHKRQHGFVIAALTAYHKTQEGD